MRRNWNHSVYDPERLGDNIRNARVSLDISQDEMALLCNMDRSYIGRIERGQVNLTVEKLYRLSEVLCVPVDRLLP